MRLAILAVITLAISMVLKAQETHLEAPRDFDSLQVNIPHGVIDTISYNSKTVGTSRKAVI